MLTVVSRGMSSTSAIPTSIWDRIANSLRDFNGLNGSLARGFNSVLYAENIQRFRPNVLCTHRCFVALTSLMLSNRHSPAGNLCESLVHATARCAKCNLSKFGAEMRQTSLTCVEIAELRQWLTSRHRKST
jgi:hypothetical protein